MNAHLQAIARHHASIKKVHTSEVMSAKVVMITSQAMTLQSPATPTTPNPTTKPKRRLRNEGPTDFQKQRVGDQDS